MSQSKPHSELLIEGYVREAQSLLSDNRIIPSSISRLCAQYLQPTYWYFQERNIWNIYGEKDQTALNAAIRSKQLECALSFGSKVVLEGHTAGKHYDESAEGGSYAMVNGTPEQYATCVIENGSGFIKAGFTTEVANGRATSIAPSSVIPTVVAIEDNEIRYMGQTALSSKDKASISRPIQNGIVQNADQLESLWKYALEEELCAVDMQNHAVLMSEPPLNGKSDREKMTQCMFETFSVPGFYVAIDAVLALYASGRTTGLVLDCGYETMHSVPIYEGYAMPHAILKTVMGGRHIDEYLAKLLKEKAVLNEMQIRDIKESLCYVANDANVNVSGMEAKEYRLPDGQVIVCKEALYGATEVLFQPDPIGLTKDDAIHQMAYRSIMKCDHDRADYYRNIVCCGGSMRFAGLRDRLLNEMKKLAPNSLASSIKVSASADKYATWTGGCILASLSTFSQMWITKEDFKESGASIVHRKCF